MKINPVFKLKWNRFGFRLLKQAMYDKKIVEAVCRAKCLRISQRDEGFDIVRIMYCWRRETSISCGSGACREASLTLVKMFSGTYFAATSSTSSIRATLYSIVCWSLSGVWIHPLQISNQ